MGVDEDITSDQWDVEAHRRHTSVAISGSHIGLVAGFASFRAPNLVRLRLFALVAAERGGRFRFHRRTFYSALADFAIPTQRAMIMIGIVGCHHQSAPPQRLSCPRNSPAGGRALRSVGRSFAGILAFLHGRRADFCCFLPERKTRGLAGDAEGELGHFTGTCTLLILFFQQVS